MATQLPVKSIKEVNLAYGKIRAIHTDARHVICACRLPDRLFHTHQDFCDDDEHNAGQFLLQLLESSEIMNRVVFVVRYYDGAHIGKKRFVAIRDAAASAVDATAFNTITNSYDTIWISDDAMKNNFKFAFGRVAVRGRPNPYGRGGGNSNRGGLQDPNRSFAEVVENQNPWFQEKPDKLKAVEVQANQLNQPQGEAVQSTIT